MPANWQPAGQEPPGEQDQGPPELPGPPAVPGAGAYTQAQATEVLRERSTVLLGQLKCWSNQWYSALAASKAAALQELQQELEANLQGMVPFQQVFTRLFDELTGPETPNPHIGRQMFQLEADWWDLVTEITAALQAQMQTCLSQLQAQANALLQQLPGVTAGWTGNLRGVEEHVRHYSSPDAAPSIRAYSVTLMAYVEAQAAEKCEYFEGVARSWPSDLQHKVDEYSARLQLFPKQVQNAIRDLEDQHHSLCRDGPEE